MGNHSGDAGRIMNNLNQKIPLPDNKINVFLQKFPDALFIQINQWISWQGEGSCIILNAKTTHKTFFKRKLCKDFYRPLNYAWDKPTKYSRYFWELELKY